LTDNTANPRFAKARGLVRARRALQPLPGIALAVAVLAFGGGAAAQSDSARSAARAAAEAGDTAFKAGKYQEAAEYFERAESMMHAPTLLLFAARSHMKLGHYVKAREAYIRVVRERMTPSSPPAFLSAQEAAKAELPDAEKKLGRATIKVDGPPVAGLQVTVDGAAAPAEMLGLPAPMDPGRHSVQIAAEGWEPGSADFTVEEQKTSEVLVHLKKSDTVVPPGGGAGAVPPGGGVPPGGDTGTPAGVNQGMRIGSYVAFGVGAVGVGLGTFFLVQKGSKNSDADSKFDEYECGTTPLPSSCGPDQVKEIESLGDDAASKGTLSVVSFVAGGAALVTGVTLFVLSGSSQSSSGQTHVTPYFAGTSAGVLGSF
jgi:hypothetical protein